MKIKVNAKVSYTNFARTQYFIWSDSVWVIYLWSNSFQRGRYPSINFKIFLQRNKQAMESNGAPMVG